MRRRIHTPSILEQLPKVQAATAVSLLQDDRHQQFDTVLGGEGMGEVVPFGEQMGNICR